MGARRLLEESRALFLTKRDVGSRKVVCAWGDCYLALVAARLGESDRARRLFASAEPWMRVHKIGHFLDRVRGVLAGAPVESVFARR